MAKTLTIASQFWQAVKDSFSSARDFPLQWATPPHRYVLRSGRLDCALGAPRFRM